MSSIDKNATRHELMNSSIKMLENITRIVQTSLNIKEQNDLSDNNLMIDPNMTILYIGLSLVIVYLIIDKLLRYELINKKEYDFIRWLRIKYENYTKKEILPTSHPKKEKQSPFISSQISPSLDNCPLLDNIEKGENVLFRFTIPYRRLNSYDNLKSKDDYAITITTIEKQINNS